MTTLADQRRAIAEQMRASRQGTSEASRRATGQAMVARRTGRNEVDDLNAVVTPPRQRRSLPAVEPRGSVPAQRGRGNYTAPAAGTGGGIASPLTAISRTFADDPVYVETIDGSGMFMVRALNTLTLEDAEGREVVITGLAFEEGTP